MKKMVKSAVVALALALSLSFGVSTTANAKVTVKKVTSVNKLTSSKKITLTKGKKATLKTTVTVTPNKAANKKVTYKSKNNKIATVSKKGVIKAKKVGSTKITVTSKKNKKKKATVTVKVVAGKVTKVTLKAGAAEIKKGETTTVKATIKTKGKKPNKALVWSTSDATVATVDKKGVVTAVAPGTVTITAQSTDGTNKKGTATIKVTGTTLALGSADVEATVELADATKRAADFDSLVAAAGLKDTDEIKVTINGKPQTKKVSDVKADLKSNKKDKTMSATVKIANADAAKYGLVGTLFAPASVKSITVSGVKFEKITADSFVIGSKTYTYTASGKNVVVDGHVAADFKALVDAKVITATEN